MAGCKTYLGPKAGLCMTVVCLLSVAVEKVNTYRLTSHLSWSLYQQVSTKGNYWQMMSEMISVWGLMEWTTSSWIAKLLSYLIPAEHGSSSSYVFPQVVDIIKKTRWFPLHRVTSHTNAHPSNDGDQMSKSVISALYKLFNKVKLLLFREYRGPDGWMSLGISLCGSCSKRKDGYSENREWLLHVVCNGWLEPFCVAIGRHHCSQCTPAHRF